MTVNGPKQCFRGFIGLLSMHNKKIFPGVFYRVLYTLVIDDPDHHLKNNFLVFPELQKINSMKGLSLKRFIDHKKMIA
jgi:hypothetical protein